MSEFTHKNSVQLVYNGTEFIDANISLIQKANKFIILQTYIFEEDAATKPIISALKESAKRGVEIFILIDGFGSRDFPDESIILLERVGIKVKLFSPLFSSNLEHIGRRLHSKLLLIDGTEGLLGGINLSQRFNAPKNSPPWLDFACLLKGEEIKNVVEKNFPLYLKYFPALVTNHLKSLPQSLVEQTCAVKTNLNDWMRLRNEIYYSYLTAIKSAKNQIIIVAPYFFPGKRFLSELAKAACRGVQVDLIFSAISDHPLERWSSRYLYSWFFSKNINIYEWGDSIVHGKLALIDNNWVTVGSYNHNFLSRFGNHELNLEVLDEHFANTVQKEVTHIKNKSIQITADKWEVQNTLKQKTLEVLSFIFTNILTIISMVVVIRRKEETDFNLME